MNAMTFDTHASVKELTAAGFSEAQAEALTTMVRQSREVDFAELATKSDLAVLRAEMATKGDLAEVTAQIADLRVATKQDFGDFRADILKWMFGAMGFQTLVVLGAVAGLYKLLH